MFVCAFDVAIQQENVFSKRGHFSYIMTKPVYCKFGNFREGFIFAKLRKYAA